jgi:hypothetical protein
MAPPGADGAATPRWRTIGQWWLDGGPEGGHRTRGGRGPRPSPGRARRDVLRCRVRAHRGRTRDLNFAVYHRLFQGPARPRPQGTDCSEKRVATRGGAQFRRAGSDLGTRVIRPTSSGISDSDDPRGAFRRGSTPRMTRRSRPPAEGTTPWEAEAVEMRERSRARDLRERRPGIPSPAGPEESELVRQQVAPAPELETPLRASFPCGTA